MRPSPSRIAGTMLCVALAACACSNGSEDEVATKAPSTSGTPAPPSYSPQHVTASLLTPKEIGGGVQPQEPTFTGFSRSTVPVCPKVTVKLTDQPATELHQFSNPADPYTDNYIRSVAVYGDHASLMRDFLNISKESAKCPGRGHVESEVTAGKKIKLQYDYSWETSEDTVNGWRHIRAVQRNEFSKTAGKSNKIDLIHDFAINGNVLISSIYFRRLPPDFKDAPKADRASELLTRQLEKLK